MLTPHRKRYLNRRVRKQVFNWVGTPGDWLLIRDRLFVYDGWNVVLELNGLDHNAVDAKYTWGLDLSGSLQGAGGLGPGAPGLGTEDLTGTVANAEAIVLNGQNQHVNVPDDPALRFGNTSFTIEAWVRLASLSTNHDPPQTVAMKKVLMAPETNTDYLFLANAGTRGASGTLDTTRGFAAPERRCVRVESRGNELALIWGNGLGAQTVALSSFRITDINLWHYVSVAFDAATHQVRFVLDTHNETVTPTDVGHCTNAGGLTLGASHGAYGVFNDFLDGGLDEVRISRGVVALDELLNVSPPHWPTTAEVEGYWRFEQPRTTVQDYSGNGLDGTVIGQAGYSTKRGVKRGVRLSVDGREEEKYA